MKFAKNIKGERIEVSFSGEKAICKDCGLEVFGRKGRFRTYWTHPNNSDCDKWYEPITKWHIDWQNQFPIEWQEIGMLDEKTKDIHRADIKLPNGVIIEIQNSPIEVDEIEQRENFYGKDLIWVLNGEKLTRQSIISYKFEKQEFAISQEIPSYLDEIEEYNMDEVNMKFWSSKLIKEIQSYKSIKNVENMNGNYYWFEFTKKIDFQNLMNEIEELISQIIINLYGYDNYIKTTDFFIIKEHYMPIDTYRNVVLEKKYWRKFIDLMERPVLIENIKGLGSNLLYWYQSDLIINKNEFIEKIKMNKNWLQHAI